MGIFTIFAFVFTAANLVYYTVVIFMDLYGESLKPKPSEGEIIPVDDEGEKQAVVVTETENGYAIGGHEVTTGATKEKTVEQEATSDASQHKDGTSQADKMQEKYDADAEQISPEWEEKYDAGMFARTMTDPDIDDSGVVLVRTYE
jgi:hypothetical protein